MAGLWQDRGSQSYGRTLYITHFVLAMQSWLKHLRNNQTDSFSIYLLNVPAGHRDLSDSVPQVVRALNEYQFDEVTNLFCLSTGVSPPCSRSHAYSPSFFLPPQQDLESAISDFAAQTKIDAKDRRALTSLTYEDVYWASKIENPLV